MAYDPDINGAGWHILIDIQQLPFEIADDCVFWDSLIMETIERFGFNLLHKKLYRFQPHGCSGIYLISESHFSFHTYPEIGVVAIDAYTCSTLERTVKSAEFIKAVVNSKVSNAVVKDTLVKRGG